MRGRERMPRRVTEEEKEFIGKAFAEGMESKEVIMSFKEEFGWTPSASQINRYKDYKPQPKEEEPKKKVEKVIEGDIDVITEDTRKIKEEDYIIDFSDGEIEEEDLERIAKAIGKPIRQTYRLLRKAYEKGYTKIDLRTGEIEK